MSIWAKFINMLRRVIGRGPITTKIVLQCGGVTMNAFVLIVGQSAVVTIVPRKVDGTASGAKLTQQSVTLSDQNNATVVMNPDGTATIKGTSVSGGTIPGSASAVCTDTDGYVQQLAMQFTVEVDPVANFADRTAGIDLDIQLSPAPTA